MSLRSWGWFCFFCLCITGASTVFSSAGRQNSGLRRVQEERPPKPSGPVRRTSRLLSVQAGALDFLEKPVDAEALLPLLARGCELHRRRRAVARDLKRAEVLWNELTDAERRTAELVAKGLPNRQAAEILGLSEDTVRSRRASVFGKLELHNAAELSEFLHDMAELRTEAHWWRTAE